MKYLIYVMSLIFLPNLAIAAYTYKDYENLRDTFEQEKKSINTRIDQANSRYIRSLNSYQRCSSDKWRVKFTTIIPEIDKRRLALDKYKREALLQSGKLNSEWLETAKDHKISHVIPNKDISDFYYWYQGHIELSKQGPLHELEVYTLAIGKLSNVYESMAHACEGTPSANAYVLAESGIRGLLNEVFSLIGKAIQ